MAIRVLYAALPEETTNREVNASAGNVAPIGEPKRNAPYARVLTDTVVGQRTKQRPLRSYDVSVRSRNIPPPLTTIVNDNASECDTEIDFQDTWAIRKISGVNVRQDQRYKCIGNIQTSFIRELAQIVGCQNAVEQARHI